MHLFSRFRPSSPLALVLAFFAAASSIVLNRVVFEALPHTEDEVAFLFQATTYARGHLLAPAPPLPAAFFIPFVIVRDGMWFGKYPPGYPLVLSLGVLVGYPPLVNALAAAACILLIVAIGRRWYDATTAWLAGLLLLVSPFFLLQAASLMAHTVCLALTLLFTWSFLATVDRPSARAAMPGMVALALLVLARPLTALGVLLPFVLWSTWRFWRVPAWRPPALLFAASGLLATAALLAYNQRTTGDPLVFGYQLWWPFDKVGFGSGISPDGHHTLRDGWFNTRRNVRALEQLLYGWPGRLDLVPAVLVNAAAVIQALAHPFRLPPGRPLSRPTTLDLLLAAQAASLILVHMAYWTTGEMYGPRYYLEALGSLALLSARGLLTALSWLETGWLLLAPSRQAPLILRVGTVLILVSLIGWGLIRTGVPFWQSYRQWNHITAEPARTIAERAPHGSLILVPARYWTDYAPFFVRNDPWLQAPVIFALDLGPGHEEAIRQAFPGRALYRADLQYASLVPLP
jgi:hypothetical protein